MPLKFFGKATDLSLLPFFCLLVVVGCSARHIYVKPGLSRPVSLAVLPVSNQSNDLEGPSLFHQTLSAFLKREGYSLMNVEEMERRLNRLGITDGGQLGAVQSVSLGQTLNVAALLYSQLEEFNVVNVGFFIQRKVSARLKMVDVLTGEVVWEAGDQVARTDFERDPKRALRKFGRALLRQTVEKTLHAPLKEETEELVYRLLRTIP